LKLNFYYFGTKWASKSVLLQTLQGEPHPDWMLLDGSIDEKLGKSYKGVIK